MMLNICVRCICETIEEAQTKTDEVRAIFADHSEANFTATANARLKTHEPEEPELNNRQG